MTRRALLQISLLALLALCWTCGGEEPSPDSRETPASPYPSTAKAAVHEQFLEDLQLERAPSDGGGSVALLLEEGEDGSVTAGGFGRWSFEYTAGSHGIAVGGSLFLLVPPFWGWSTPQAQSPERPGYTTVSTEAGGVQVTARTVDRSLLMIEISGRDLEPGERIQITYGAGDALARADDYAESNSAFYFKVDGDGDGLSGLVNSFPAIQIRPGPTTRIAVTGPSTAQPGSSILIQVAALDAMANPVPGAVGTLTIESVPEGLEHPLTLALTADDGGYVAIPVTASASGIFRVRATLQQGESSATAISNPVCVRDGVTPVYWGDLHGHSNYSDGTGTPREYYAYARDVSALDFAVLTDHDHFGVRFLDANPGIWDEIRQVNDEFNDPGQFLSLLGYEWTSWLHGHRHVVYFNGQGEVLSSVGAATTTPAELWAALEGQPVLTFAHHSAGAPVATDWSYRPDPLIEPVTEIMSVHGSSEADDSPSRIRGGVPGNFVRDQLDDGMRFGFIGSGDSHDGHPGHAHLSPNAGYRRARPDPRGKRAEERLGQGGLAAVRASDLTQASLLSAFRARSTYATSGPRIWLQTTLDGHPMGANVKHAPELSFKLEFACTSPVEYVELIQRGRAIERIQFGGTLEATMELGLTGLSPGDYVYVRLLQNDGALAWSSPNYLN
ncbi:MAG: hypothetical protein ACI9F9_001089 [Candidatus Paceibacteria bacterium]|jgi:hypothetical protein